MPRLYLAAALAAALSAAAPGWAATPGDIRKELRSLVDATSGDTAKAVLRERAISDTIAVSTMSGDPPWKSDRVCDVPRQQFWQAFGWYVVHHVRQPPEGERSAMRWINTYARRNVDVISRNLPPPDRARFLHKGETLAAAPESWDQALRQRAEWSLVLEDLQAALAERASDRHDYAANYTMALWSRVGCEFVEGDRRFLDSYLKEAGAPPSGSSDRAAYDLLVAAGRPAAPETVAP